MNSARMIIFIMALTGTGVLLGPCILALLVKKWRSEFPKVAIPFTVSLVAFLIVSLVNSPSKTPITRTIENSTPTLPVYVEHGEEPVDDVTTLLVVSVPDNPNNESKGNHISAIEDESNASDAVNTVIYPSDSDSDYSVPAISYEEDNTVDSSGETKGDERETNPDSNNESPSIVDYSNSGDTHSGGNSNNFNLYYDANKHGNHKYVLDTATKKVHKADCRHVKKIKDGEGGNWEETDSYDFIMEYYRNDNSWEFCQWCLKGWHLGYDQNIEPIQSQTTDQSESTGSGEYVWIPKTGDRYHSKESCSGMKNPEYVSVEEAESRGFTPCDKCYNK